MIVMPEQDAVLAITAETPDMQEEIDLVWQYLLPAFKESKLPPDAAAVERLKEKTRTLALPPLQKNTRAFAASINGKTFTASSNVFSLKNIGFNFSNDLCRVKFQTDTTSYEIAFGTGKWRAGETRLPEPALTGSMIENNSMIYPAKITASYGKMPIHSNWCFGILKVRIRKHSRVIFMMISSHWKQRGVLILERIKL